jgi:hypothetical protein
MKVALTLLLLVATGTSVFAAETAPASPAADEAYQRFRAVRYAQVPRLADVQETSRLQMKQHDDSSRLAEKFYEQFPADARKWEVVGVAVNSPRQFSGPDAAADQAAWEKKRNEWRRMLLADVSVPANIWTTVAEWTIGDMAGSRGRPVRDLAWAGEVVAQMAARVPASERRKFAEQAYLDSLQKKDPAAAERFLRTRVGPTETNAAVKEMAAGRLRIVEAMSAPLDLKFTAADGREVDLAKLRGKVVLVDFWATCASRASRKCPTSAPPIKNFTTGASRSSASRSTRPPAPSRAGWSAPPLKSINSPGRTTCLGRITTMATTGATSLAAASPSHRSPRHFCSAKMDGSPRPKRTAKSSRLKSNVCSANSPVSP